MHNQKPTIALIGAGAAGTSLTLALKRRGYRVTAIASQSLASAQQCASRLDSPRVTTVAAEAARGADLVIIATPDRVIKSVCDEIAAAAGFSENQTVMHLSGAMGASALESARDAGATTLSFHPIQTLSDPKKGADLLNGSCFCLEGDARAIEQAKTLVDSLEGSCLVIEERDKALYHAALCVASNYLVVVEDIAVRLLNQAGIEQQQALKALLPLIQGSVDNLRHSGLPDALTGPISRGDSGTVRSHLAALEDLPEAIRSIYGLLGKEGVAVAEKKGNIDNSTAVELRVLLDGNTP